MNSIDKLIDQFVNSINSSENEPLDEDEVVKSLRTGVQNEWGQFYWKIAPRNLLKQTDELQNKLPKKLPKSYSSFISRYAFPGFEMGPIFFFANTGEDDLWELSKRILTNNFMSLFLFNNNFIQFGNPDYRSYDPVCFDCRQSLRGVLDYPIVQIDHEGIIIKKTIIIVKEIASSFTEFAETVINKNLV